MTPELQKYYEDRFDMMSNEAWKDYCQALRDVPSQAGFPWTIEWPDAPNI